MKPFTPFTLHGGEVAPQLTQAQADALFTTAEQAAGEKRGEISTRGPWSIITRYRAVCADHVSPEGPECATWYGGVRGVTGALVVYGVRSLDKPRESGYELEGFVSIRGRKFSAFTSSQLFTLPNGKLLNCAILYPRTHGGLAIPHE